MSMFRHLVGVGLGLTLATSAGLPARAATPAEASRRAVITVKGLACPFCVYGLEKHLKKLPGATTVRVDLGKGEATVDFAGDSKVADEDIRKAVKNAGFTVDRIEWRGAPLGGSREEANEVRS